MSKPLARWRIVGRALCNVALVWIAVNIFAVLDGRGSAQQECRMSWDRIEEYPVLAEVCKNGRVRQAMRGEVLEPGNGE